MKKIVLVSDVWTPQKDGVVTTLINTKKRLESEGYSVSVIHPGLFWNMPLPYYKDLELSFWTGRKMKRLLERQKPDYIHLATPGPLGLSARNICLKKKWRFTTYYHTRVPEYMKMRFGTLEKITYDYLLWFNKKADKMMVSTPTMKKELEKKGFKNIVICPLGVDVKLFKKNTKAKMPKGLQEPIFTFVGRINPEKNIEAFLKSDLPGSKLIVGEGGLKSKLQEKYKENVLFVGKKNPKEVIDYLSISDVFVFPSKTDTFGLSILEALSCGVPVAAYNVTGPKDIISNGFDGFYGSNLKENALNCLTLNSKDCRKTALKYSWENSIKTFLENLTPI